MFWYIYFRSEFRIQKLNDVTGFILGIYSFQISFGNFRFWTPCLIIIYHLNMIEDFFLINFIKYQNYIISFLNKNYKIYIMCFIMILNLIFNIKYRKK